MEAWWKREEIREPTEYERREPLRLGAGIHEITFEDDGREITTQWNDKVIEKRVFNVRYGNQAYAWFVTKGQTTESLYGQLVKAAEKLGGLAGHKIKIIVAGKGRSRRYQVDWSSLPQTASTSPLGVLF